MKQHLVICRSLWALVFLSWIPFAQAVCTITPANPVFIQGNPPPTITTTCTNPGALYHWLVNSNTGMHLDWHTSTPTMSGNMANFVYATLGSSPAGYVDNPIAVNAVNSLYSVLDTGTSGSVMSLNGPPTCTITNAPTAPVPPGTWIGLVASCNFSAALDIEYRWEDQQGNTSTGRFFGRNPTTDSVYTLTASSPMFGLMASTQVVVTMAPTVSSVQPTSATLNQLTTFTVTGQNLISGMGFAIPDCTPSSNEVGTGSSTRRTFQCTPGGSTGTKIGVVKSRPGGSQLNSFQIAVKTTPPPNYITVTTPPPATLSAGTDSERLIVVTHGWNSDTNAWPNELVRAICSKLGANVLNDGPAAGIIAKENVTGIDKSCRIGKWEVMSYNWSPAAALPRPPEWAVVNASFKGREFAASIRGKKYVHLIGHSAGSALIETLSSELKKQSPASYIHSTFLDAYCPIPDHCFYGANADKAEQYVDNRFSIDVDLTDLAGLKETNVSLPNALNFDVTKLDGFKGYSGVNGVQFHAFPYKYYVTSAGGALLGWEFSLATGKAPTIGAPWAAWSVPNATSNSFDPVAWSKTTPHPLEWSNGSRCILDPSQSATLPPFGCYNSLGGVKYTVVNTLFGPPTLVASECSPTLSGTLTSGSGSLNLPTCIQMSPQSKTTRYTKGAANVTPPQLGMALLSVAPEQVANRIRFNYRFVTPGANASLQVYLNDSLIYVTDQALDGDLMRNSDWIDAVDMQPVNQSLRFVARSSTAVDIAVEISDLEFSNVAPQAKSGNYIAVAADGDGNGSLTVSGVNCGPGCSDYHANGSTVTATATPFSGSIFSGWTGTCVGTASGNGDITFSAVSDCTLIANFTLKQPSSVTPTPTGPVDPYLSLTGIPAGFSGYPSILNLGSGDGPAMTNCLMATLGQALGGNPVYQGQNANGGALVAWNGQLIVFYPLDASTSSNPGAGVNLQNGNTLNVVTGCGTFTVSPAMADLSGIGAILNGMGLNGNINAQGVITVLVNGTYYVVRPDYLVTPGAPGTPSLVMGADGLFHYTDGNGNSQILRPAFLDTDSLQNQLILALGALSFVIQTDGTALLSYGGHQYVLTPDLTLGLVPPAHAMDYWWPDGLNHYSFRINAYPYYGLSQGFTVR